MQCPFCNLPTSSRVAETKLSVAFRDAYPVSPGHTLVVPRRHTERFFDLSSKEQADLIELTRQCEQDLKKEYSPSGYNIGVNDGQAAGQTVMHVHLHLIPRYEGDSKDPRGGIRWVLPEQAPYWKTK